MVVKILFAPIFIVWYFFAKTWYGGTILTLAVFIAPISIIAQGVDISAEFGILGVLAAMVLAIPTALFLLFLSNIIENYVIKIYPNSSGESIWFALKQIKM